MKSDLDNLKYIAEDVLKNKELDRLRAKLTERAQEIKDAPESVMTDFYCDECQRDFGAIGHKQVRIPEKSVWFAFYETHCPEGHKAIRHITDKLEDPYFLKSPFVRAQQVEFEEAMIGPDDPRFETLYPEAYKKLQSKQFEREFTQHD